MAPQAPPLVPVDGATLDFVGLVIITLGLFYFRSIKLHYVEEIHMMLVAFRRCENCCSSPAQKISKEIYDKIC